MNLFLKGATVGLICAVLGGAAVAFAGSGVGGVFNLGQTNTVNAGSNISGSTNGSLLGAYNSNTGANAVGVNATTASPTASALLGTNNGSGIGLRGNSATGIGVFAQSGSTSLPAMRIQNTGGFAAGSFLVNPGVAPFKVNSTTKVDSLNADLLDGKDSSDLAGHAYGVDNPFAVTALTTSLTTVASVAVPAGSFVANFSTTIAGSSSASPDNVGCYLFGPAGGEATAAYGNTYATDDQSVIAGQGLVSTTTGGNITLQCVDSNNSASAFYASLIANDVGTVSGYVASAPRTAPRSHGPRP